MHNNFILVSGGKLKKGIKELNDYIINHVNKKYGKYNLRLFIDNSIYNDNEIMNKLNNMKGLEIVLYTCSDYLNKNNNKHWIIWNNSEIFSNV